MKKLVIALLTLPTMAMAHPGGAHSHPEEITGGLILLVAAAGAYWLWKRNKRD